jgi:hypothetical protein
VRGLVAGPDGRIVVCEPDRRRFSVVAADGAVRARFVLDAVRPWHATPWRDDWLVVDAEARRIYLVDAAGGPPRPFVSQQRMKDPRSAQPTGDDTFVYCDRGRSVAAEVDRAGRWLWTHGRLGFAADADDCLASAEHVLPLAGGGQILCDTRNNRVLHRATDGSSRVMAGGGGRIGSAPGHLNAPVCAALASDGALLIADAGNGRLLRVEPDGGERTLWGSPAVERLRFHFPRCMEPIGRGWLVADSRNNRVVTLDPEGALGDPTVAADGQPLFWPRFATEIESRRFLCDSRNGRVLHGRPGEPLARFDLLQNGRRIAMSDPHVVRPAAAGGITISDTDACRLVHATLDGEVLGAWGGPPHSSSTATPVEGQVMLEVEDLHDGVLAADGALWLVDTANHRLLSVDREGTVRREIRRLSVPRPDLADELFWPRTVEPVGADHLLVTDAGNHRVVLITLDGRLVGVFGGRRGHARGHLADPRFARHHRGEVLITDYQNHRLLVVTLAQMRALAAPHGAAGND